MGAGNERVFSIFIWREDAWLSRLLSPVDARIRRTIRRSCLQALKTILWG